MNDTLTISLGHWYTVGAGQGRGGKLHNAPIEGHCNFRSFPNRDDFGGETPRH